MQSIDGGMSGEDAPVSSKWQDYFRETAQPEIRNLLESYPETRSFNVDIIDLHSHDPDLAQQLLASPDSVIQAGETTLAGVHEDFERVNIRLVNHPGLLNCRDVRAKHIQEIVTIEGEITDNEQPNVSLVEAVYECLDCTHKFTKHPNGLSVPDPTHCPSCDTNRRPVFQKNASVFVDIQKLVLEDTPSPNGSTTVEFPVVVDDDLVASLSINTNTRITGVVRVDDRSSANIFRLYLDAVGVEEEPSSGPDEPKELHEVIQSRWEHMVQ